MVPSIPEEVKGPAASTEPVRVVETLLERMQHWDRGKIEQLMNVLNLIDRGVEPDLTRKLGGVPEHRKEASVPVAPVVPIMPIATAAAENEEIKCAPAPATQEKARQKEPAPAAVQMREEKPLAPVPMPTPGKAKKNELIFRILSTWGHPHVAGLTEIALYDINGRRMVTPIIARNLFSGPTQPVSKLTNGKIYMNDEKFMWIAYLPPPPRSVELVFTLPTEGPGVGGIVVWNYNKNTLDSVKGVREAEIVLNGSVAWSGTVKRGNGRTNEDYSTEILLCKDPSVFKDKPRAPAGETDELEMPKDLLKRKQEIEDNLSRPISVPIWLQGQQFGESKSTRGVGQTKFEPSVNVSTKASETATNRSNAQIKEVVPDMRRKSKDKAGIFSDRPFGAKSKFSKPESKVAANRGRRQNAGVQQQQQRDMSMERHIDSVVYFEASKPQRLLRKKGGEGQRKAASEAPTHKIAIPELQRAQPILSKPDLPPKDILDEFIQGHELGMAPSAEKKTKAQTVGVTFDSLRKQYENAKNFVVPELPTGRVLTLDILSTWADPYYVGLSGIEVFTAEGMALNIHPHQLTAEPRDITVLPENSSDPRTLDKLVDGTYFTKDDLHEWLAPYTPGSRHYVNIDLGMSTSIAMIRIWNYNKSRVHSERGVKDLIITLDEKTPIFQGEIRKAPGTLSDLQQCCEVLLFTSSEETIKQICEHDWIETVEVDQECVESHVEERPPTASKRYTVDEIMQIQLIVAQKEATERPLTTASRGKQASIKEQIAAKDKELAMLQVEEEKRKLVAQTNKQQAMVLLNKREIE